VWSVPGNFSIDLTVADAAGNSDSVNFWINVADISAPAVDAGTNQTITPGTLVNFDGSGSTDNVGIINYSWEFVDGVTIYLYGVNPSYTFTAGGIYNVILMAVDAAGNQGTDRVSIFVILLRI